MSRLSENGVQDTLLSKLEVWINNPPDYYEMTKAYKEQGKLKAEIIRLKRQIQKAEEQVTIDVDKPRSNDAKKAKLEATSDLRDLLALIEAKLEIIDAEIKALEFRKVMFNASNYRTRLSVDF